MKLIIINGDTSTGKTTIVQRLHSDLVVDVFEKDVYKEGQYDLLGRAPNLFEWLAIESKTWQALYVCVEDHYRANRPLLIEGNFGRKQKRHLDKLVQFDDVREIFCFAKPKIVLQRFVARNELGRRHIGHRDSWWYGVVYVEQLCARLGWHWVRPVTTEPNLLRVDTSDFDRISYEVIRNFCS